MIAKHESLFLSMTEMNKRLLEKSQNEFYWKCQTEVRNFLRRNIIRMFYSTHTIITIFFSTCAENVCWRLVLVVLVCLWWQQLGHIISMGAAFSMFDYFFLILTSCQLAPWLQCRNHCDTRHHAHSPNDCSEQHLVTYIKQFKHSERSNTFIPISNIKLW